MLFLSFMADFFFLTSLWVSEGGIFMSCPDVGIWILLHFVLLRVYYAAVGGDCICVSENHEHQPGYDLQGHGDQSTAGQLKEVVGLKSTESWHIC